MDTTQIPWRNYDMPQMVIRWYFQNSPRLIVSNISKNSGSNGNKGSKGRVSPL